VRFGDPWTPAQRALVDVVIAAWGATGRWPLFQHVARVLEEERHEDAAEVLRSFPSLGARGSISRAYADVNFDHIQPFPPEDSIVSLSVAGLARHPQGEQTAQAFAAVLRYVAERWAQAPHNPSAVVEVTVTSEEAERALAQWPKVFIISAVTVIRSEPLRGILSSGQNLETQAWNLSVDRRISRYRDLTVDRYLSMIAQEYARPPGTQESRLLSSRLVDSLPTDDVHLAQLLRMAVAEFQSAEPIRRWTGLRNLADAYERIKTLSKPGRKNKAQSIAALVTTMTPDAEIGEHLNGLMKTLTDASNRYTIRHHEVGTIEIINDAELIDFLFYSYYNVVRFALLRLNGEVEAS
jgi:hypothetical protein